MQFTLHCLNVNLLYATNIVEKHYIFLHENIIKGYILFPLSLSPIMENKSQTLMKAIDFTNAKYDLELQSDTDHYASGSGGGKFTTRLLYGTVTVNKRFSKSSTALDCT